MTDKHIPYQESKTEQDIDAIMDAIMQKMREDDPSPLDGEHHAKVEHAKPLEYDYINYDEQPAVLLGPGAFTSSKPWGADTPSEVNDPTYEALESLEVIEPFTEDGAEPSVPMQADKTISFVDAAHAVTTLTPELLESSESEEHMAGWKAPWYLSILPAVIHGILAIALGAGVAAYFIMSPGGPYLPVASGDMIFHVIIALAAFAVLGVVMAFASGLILRQRAPQASKDGWITSSCFKFALTILLGLVLWVAGMLVADQVASAAIVLI